MYNKSGKADQPPQEIGRAESVYNNKSGKAKQTNHRSGARLNQCTTRVVKQTNHRRGARLNQTNHRRGARLNQCTTRVVKQTNHRSGARLRLNQGDPLPQTLLQHVKHAGHHRGNQLTAVVQRSIRQLELVDHLLQGVGRETHSAHTGNVDTH